MDLVFRPVRVFRAARRSGSLSRSAPRVSSLAPASAPAGMRAHRGADRDRLAPRRLRFENLESRINMALDVPAFSSLPGANQTIYLDFNGHTTTGTSWNSSYGVTTINSPAYSTDTDTANFSASELATIERVFKRVAEDFAPFNVNVTTVEPVIDDLRKTSSTDTRWGVRSVVTKDVAFNCGCGGIAYIDSFNWSSDTPVFVFNTGEVGVAEAASHEVGHAMGLSHDGTSTAGYYQGHGTGATSWAPIMGVGYYVNVSQWDRGEYTGSNNGGSSANYGKGPDDLAIITGYNGFGYRADTAGNTQAAASPLTVSGTSVSGSGIIETRTDADFYSFLTGAGAVSLNINPAGLGANLDIRADLYDAAGNLVATSDNTAALNATLNVTLAEGTYYLKVDGVGVGTPTASPPTGYTDYASIGQYTITGSIVTSTGSSVSVSATSAANAEGNTGSTPFTFTVTRSGDTSQSATVDFAVTGSGTSAANGADFVGGVLPSGTLTFDPGVLSQTITLNVQGDTLIEASETFTLALSNPTGGLTITTASATGTIQNDDAPPAAPTLSIAATSASKAEGTGATPTPFVFTINRSGDLSGTSSVRYSVTGTGSKKATSADFVNGLPTGVQVSFAAGVAAVDITLNVIADSVKEPNETFRVALSSATGATIATGTANGSILNDDGTSNAAIGSERDGGRYYGENGDARVNKALIAVADPLWAFVPAEYLTPEQLAVPVITWIDGTPFIGDLAHDHEHGHDHDHEGGFGHDHEHDDAHDHDHEFAAFDHEGSQFGSGISTVGLESSLGDGSLDVGIFTELRGAIGGGSLRTGQVATSRTRGVAASRPLSLSILDAAIVEESASWMAGRSNSDDSDSLDSTDADSSNADALIDGALADWA
ncbi:MAG: hypothetical protein RLY70_2959 [Planctomycetota bacterium]